MHLSSFSLPPSPSPIMHYCIRLSVQTQPAGDEDSHLRLPSFVYRPCSLSIYCHLHLSFMLLSVEPSCSIPPSSLIIDPSVHFCWISRSHSRTLLPPPSSQLIHCSHMLYHPPSILSSLIHFRHHSICHCLHLHFRSGDCH